MEKWALIVAGGSGTRMGTTIPKQFLPLSGIPLLVHTVTAFQQAYPAIRQVIVLPAAYQQTAKEELVSLPGAESFLYTAGGDTRFQSVKNGLAFVPVDCVCFVHDAVRCLVSIQLIRHCYEMALQHGHAVPAIAPADSMRIEDGSGIYQPLDRSKVRLIQTPQTFHSSLLKAAFNQPYHPSFTDEASVVERSGLKIKLVEGEITNLKITTPLDLLIAERIMEQRKLS